MRQLVPSPIGLQSAGFFLAFCVLLAWGEKVTQAGCGDYVLVNGQVLHQPAPQIPMPYGKLPGPKPCHGPECSQQPMTSPTPPSSQPSIERLELIAGRDSDIYADELNAFSYPDSMRLPPQWMLSGIFRPPCSVVSAL